MKIKSLRIKNFRSFHDVTIEFDDYNAFVGSNGAGKSTVLCALNIFFRQTEGVATNLVSLDEEDFHNGNVDEPVEITVTFGELSDQAKNDFKEYFRQEVLIISSIAAFDKVSRTAKVVQSGKRTAISAFSEFFRKYNDGVRVAELMAEYEVLREKYMLPAIRTKDGMRDALRDFEEMHQEECVLISSEDEFYGFSKGANRLDKYVQWVYVPAVKDATTENAESRNSALGKLLARTVRSKVKFDEEIAALRAKTVESYRSIINAQQGALSAISEALTARLAQWAHPGAIAKLEWVEDPKKSIQIDEPTAKLFAGEDGFTGDLARFGHGLQRSYLLALLQELATSNDDGQPRLILGCEEPELYQHPPQARHLASVFRSLTSGNAQVFASTHSPYFVSGRHFENVRLVRRDDSARASFIRWTTCDAVSKSISEVSGEVLTPIAAERAYLHQALQPNINEMFFAKKVIFVEGLEDVSYITTWLHYTGRWDEFRRFGIHVVPANGKNHLIEPLVIATQLGIPYFLIFDADANQVAQRKVHERDNTILLKLAGGDHTVPFPEAVVWARNHICWPTNFGKALRASVGEEKWQPAYAAASKGLGNPEGSFQKNHVHIADHLFELQRRGADMTILDRVCNSILTIGNHT